MAVYIALGSNLGNRRANMAMALRMLDPLARLDAVSALYESPPQAPSPPPAYLNAAARIVTGLTPELLLRHLQRIEHLIGRRSRERWAPRPIDLDIVLYDDAVVDSEDLQIPHPRLGERDFVLRPLLDLDQDLTLPAGGKRLDALLAEAGQSALVVVQSGDWLDVIGR